MINAGKEMMVKRSLSVLLFILLLIPAIFLIWRSVEYISEPDKDKTFLKPELKFSDLYAYGFTEEKIKLNGDLVLKNHLPFALKADSFSYTLFMEGAKILKTTYTDKLTLPARDTLIITLPFTVLKKQLDSIGNILLKQGSDTAEYSSEFKFYASSWLAKQWVYKKVKYKPVFHLLDIKLEKLKIEALKKKGVFYTVRLTFKNKNVVPVIIKNTDYFIYLGDVLLAKGSKKERLKFPAKNTSVVDFPANISYGHFAKLLGAYSFGNGKQLYKLVIRFVIETKREKFNNTRTIITRTGPLEEVFDFNKDEK